MTGMPKINQLAEDFSEKFSEWNQKDFVERLYSRENLFTRPIVKDAHYLNIKTPTIIN